MPRIFLIVVAQLLAVTAFAQQEQERLTAEVLWQLDRVGAPRISPDGDQVVVPVTSYPDDSDEAESRIWLLGENARPLTIAGGKASDPVFSPDGSRLAFVSSRNEEEAGQVYVLPMDGPGEAQVITDVPTGASGLKWVGEHIYFVSNVWPGKTFEEMAEILEQEKEKKVSAMVWTEMPYSFWDHYLDEDREQHVYRVAAEGGDVEALTLETGYAIPPDSAYFGAWDVSPDEETLAFVADARAGEPYGNYDIFLLDVGGSDARNITPDNEASDANPMFSPDGKLLAYTRQNIQGFYGDQSKLVLRRLGNGETREVHGDWDRSADGLVWAPDSRGFYGAIDDAGTRRVYYLPADGKDPRRITEATDFDSLDIAASGELVGRNQSFVYPPRIVRIYTRPGSTERLDTFNDEQLADIDMGTYESVTYTGADGDDIQMWVHYPPGFDRDGEYPLFLLIHGGPHGAITDTFHFRWNAMTFSSWGYVTAWPNFHGSSGFGQEFTDSINPDWATKPYEDVIAAADWFAEKPWIDSDRMVAGGGSYGGYLSTILLGREHPFNALVIHAAVYNLYSQNSADFAVHEERFGPYWENKEAFESISPHLYAAEFDTPSLIIHGQNDLRVPVGQAFELYRALQLRDVDSRLVYYPDENHWILKRGNSLHWYKEVHDWVAKYAEPGSQE
jgi:dipeptidyl aminopeptidase/acylaminoacyl peptidase